MPNSSDSICAGFFPRAAAFLLDCIIAGLATLIVRFISLIVKIFTHTSTTNLLFSFDITDIICYIIFTGYFVIFTGLTGSTLGKKAMRLRVIKADGSRIGFFDALYRETIGRYLTSILCIGYLVAACDTYHRGFSDMLCDTRVVYSFKNSREGHVKPDNIMAMPNGQDNLQTH